ncbi:hypothetical protein KEM56_005925 [Ascosphaera pollenicola]|nr:hypothetical protein KEM56_005925 [Ascosphaera pollenicola]
MEASSRWCAELACDDFLTERGSPLKEGAAARMPEQHTVELLERRLRSEMQEAATSDAIKETRLWCVDVPSEVIDHLCETKTAVQLKEYDRGKKRIKIRMPTLVHESASRLGERMVTRALSRANMARSMEVTRQPTCPDVPWRTRRGKVPDASFQLRPRYRMGYHLEMWPQIVIESGMSEPNSDLTADAAWWFKIAGSFVRIVMTIAVSPTDVNLTIWLLGSRKGTSSRFGTIDALRNQGKLEVTTTTPIVVPFSAVFIREKNEGEEDLVFRPEDFTSLKDDLERHINERESMTRVRNESPPYLSATIAHEEFLIEVDQVPQPKRRRAVSI